MKNKFLICLFGIFSFFLFSIDSKAVNEVILDYTNAFDYVKEKGLTFKHSNITVDFTEKLEELISVLDNNNIYYSVVINKIPYYGCKNNESYCFPGISIIQYKNDSVSLNFELSNLDSGYKLYPNLSSNDIIKSVSFSYPSLFTEEKFLSYFDNLISYINENKSLPSAFDVTGWTGYTPSSGPYGLGSVIFDSDFNYSDSNSGVGGFLFYDSNVDHKIKNMSNFDGLKISDQIYIVDSSFPTYKSIYGKTVYTEDFRINSKDIDRIEYTFEIPENQLFMHEFNFSTTWYSKLARLDLFSVPFLEYKLNDVSYNLPLDVYKISTLDDVTYYDTQINSFQDGTKDLKFIVNFNNINALDESSVFIHFDSQYPFSRKIVYISDEDSSTNYYEEVDFSNRYGVLLIPKLIQNNLDQQVYSTIYYQGKALKIRVYDSVDTSKDPIYYIEDYNNINKVWGNFNYLFKFNNKNQILFFTNDNYLVDSESSIIKYDTRYFVYTLCNSSNSCDSIINPNTGEEIYIIPPEITKDNNVDDGGLFSMFHFFEKPIKFIFDSVGVLYNDYADPIVQKYWYFTFGFTIFLLVLRLLF